MPGLRCARASLTLWANDHKTARYMTSSRKWLLGSGLVLGIVVLAGVALARLMPSDEELAVRAAAALGTATGVQVSVGAVHWRLLPRPAVTVEDIATQQNPPVKITSITLWPNLTGLWHKHLKFDSAEVDGAVLPQASLRELGSGKPDSAPARDASVKTAVTAPASPTQSSNAWVTDELPLAQLVFRDVTWISRSGVAAIFSGDADFDTAWRPRSAHLRRPDAKAATDLTLTRKGAEDRWDALVHIGGGTATGVLELSPQPNGRLHLAGKLKFEGVEVASAVQAFNRRAVIAGKASGVTSLKANGDNAAELAQSLHTQTLLTMGPSTLLLFDLSKAVRTFGKEHNGQTALDKVSGQMDTQNTANGMVIDFSGLKASSGVLTASGKVHLLSRMIDAEVAVDLVDGVVGVPLTIKGPLDKVKVSVPNGALVGAAVGTALLPGVGTAIGARLGAALGNIFGSAEPAAKPPGAAPGKR